MDPSPVGEWVPSDPMDGNPQLLTDVKFSTHRKGYDPDEVDNFLERVSAAVAQLQDKLRLATERAETADAQLVEARRLQTEAEAALEAGGGAVAGTGDGAGSGDEELKKVLVLAQRAADQAVEEANATATRTVADARAKSVNLLAEAEAERDRMLAKARKKADAAAEERARELHEQVTTLDAARRDLQADVDALDGFLDTERDRLRRQLGEITRIVDDPAALSLLATPELSETEVPELATEEPDPEPEAVAPVEADPGLAELQEGPIEAPVSGDSSESSVDAPVASADYPGPEGIDESSSLAPASSESLPADAESIDLTTERLFGEGESGIDDGPPTELFDTMGDAAPSPLGEPDEAADAAMRAFFERDLDEDADAKSSRFGRRR
jgi:DivIVA domain-containing protein